jgi:hypothetical protein
LKVESFNEGFRRFQKVALVFLSSNKPFQFNPETTEGQKFESSKPFLKKVQLQLQTFLSVS